MTSFAIFFSNLLHFLVVWEKNRVPVVISHISVRVRVLPESENRDRVDSGNRFFGSGFGYPITRAASNPKDPMEFRAELCPVCNV